MYRALGGPPAGTLVAVGGTGLDSTFAQLVMVAGLVAVLVLLIKQWHGR